MAKDMERTRVKEMLRDMYHDAKVRVKELVADRKAYHFREGKKFVRINGHDLGVVDLRNRCTDFSNYLVHIGPKALEDAIRVLPDTLSKILLPEFDRFVTELWTASGQPGLPPKWTRLRKRLEITLDVTNENWLREGQFDEEGLRADNAQPKPTSRKLLRQFTFDDQGLVEYRCQNYSVNSRQRDVLKECVKAWDANGKKKTIVHSRAVCGPDPNDTIGRIFRGHPFLSKLRLFKKLGKPRGAFSFNP